MLSILLINQLRVLIWFVELFKKCCFDMINATGQL